MILPLFIKGVWQQPFALYEEWKRRGVNTLVDFPLMSDGKTPQDASGRKKHLDEARRLGMYVICEPSNDLTVDLSYNETIFAWLQKPDEPDNQEHLLRKPDGSRDFDASIKVWKDRFVRLKGASGKRIYGNFNGMQVTSARTPPWPLNDPAHPIAQRNAMSSDYEGWITACDMYSADWHVINSGRDPSQIVPLFTNLVTRLKTWSNSAKSVLAFIECAFQNRAETGARGPTPQEMRVEVETAISLGVEGVIYFPNRVRGGYVADAVTKEMVVEMVKLNGDIDVKYPPPSNNSAMDQFLKDYDTWIAQRPVYRR